MRPILDDVLSFAGWMLVGVGVALGFLSLPFLLLPVVGLVWLLARRSRSAAGGWGAAAGLGLVLLFVAYVQRHGPGEYCHATGTARYPGTECGDYMDPRPWLVAGLLLTAAGIGGFVVHLRRRTPTRA